MSTADKVHDYFGYGMWEAYGSGRVTIGVSDEYEVGSEGGEEKHMLTVDEMPNHRHNAVSTSGSNIGISLYPFQMVCSNYSTVDTNVILPQGGSQSHNNMQPYRTVYRWRRIA